MEAARQSLHHTENHLTARFGRHFAGCDHVVWLRPRRRHSAGTLDTRKRLAHHRKPRRIRGCLGDEIAPYAGGFAAISILLSGKAQIEHRLEVICLQRRSAFERRFGIGRDDPAGRGCQCLAEINLAFGRCTQEAQCTASRFDGVIITLKPHVDRRQHLPTPSIVRILFEMSLDPRNEGSDGRGLAVLRIAAGDRLAGQIRRSQQRVEWARDQKDCDDCSDQCGDTSPAAGRRLRCPWPGRVGCAEQAARYLNPSRLELVMADAAVGTVALDLLELVTIDREIAASGLQRTGARQRPDYGTERRRSHRCQDRPEHHINEPDLSLTTVSLCTRTCRASSSISEYRGYNTGNGGAAMSKMP